MKARSICFLALAGTLVHFLFRDVCFAAAASTLLNRPSHWGVDAVPADLRVEWLRNPMGIDSASPRLSWRVDSKERAVKQVAYRLLVASSECKLQRDEGDLWDSGKVESDETLNIPYRGKTLRSGQQAFWKVEIWTKSGSDPLWSSVSRWSMGLLQPEDWTAQWISFKDSSPAPNDRSKLCLPPAHYYRKDFPAGNKVTRATLYVSALGLCEIEVNGNRVTDGCFEPGWSDYRKRAYYRTHDVTALVHNGANAIGAVVTDGWYAGYVGYGLLVGYGPNRCGRCFYGKTPALLAQLEIEYADGTRQTVRTDPTWKVSDAGPVREADLIMGESYDARREFNGWSKPRFDDRLWTLAIPAAENGSTKAVFSDTMGDREVELGFQRPGKMQAYSGPPVRVTAVLPVQKITEPKPGVFIFDMGQNFAGVIRLKAHGPAGAQVRMRYGEMLHANGELMTENLRRARATDFYTFRGDPKGEEWTPRFTYHGFQYVELTGLPSRPGPDTVVGLVLQSDTPPAGNFECSDDVMTKFAKNAQWTQRANFIELPTDCPQRDERLGWMGDAQTYIRTASFNADVSAFFTKWMDDVEEAQRDFGAYPDYCPYPMSHGAPGKTFGTAWMDAGVICPWTIWKVYGDTRIIERHWESLTRFMDWRKATMRPDGLGVSIGNTWGDWLNVNEPTPIEYIDACYHALDCDLMSQMAAATGRRKEAGEYRSRFEFIRKAFLKRYANQDGSLSVDTQTAYALALWVKLLPPEMASRSASILAGKIQRNGNRMSTGFLGTRALLLALSENGQPEVAQRLFQSRSFPSWGYEVVNGANTVWERWDSYTREHGFEGQGGNQNAAMNSFSHYSFGAVMEWAYRHLAGIDTDGAGYHRIIIKPEPIAAAGNEAVGPITWVSADYAGARGKISSDWKIHGHEFELDVTIPPNITATIYLPGNSAETVREGRRRLRNVQGAMLDRVEHDRVVLSAGSGHYHFVSQLPESWGK